MPKQIGYAIFVLVTVLAVIGAVREFANHEANTSEDAGALMFPDFKANLNDSATIKVVGEDGAFTLKRESSGQWVFVEKGNYPVNGAKVNEMLVGLTQLTLLDKKTSKPKRYVKLGLAEPGAQDSKAQRFTVLSQADKVLLDVILGSRKAARGEPNMSEIYVRKPTDAQTWNALASLPIAQDSVDWLGEELVKIDDKRIRSIVVLHEDGQIVTVVRAPSYGQGYKLHNVPEGREVDNEFVVRNIATTLSNLELDDVVVSVGAAPAGDKPLSFALTTYDGLEITINTVKSKDDRMSLVQAKRVPRTEIPAEATSSERKEDKVVVLPEADVDGQVAAFNKRWGGYIFALADWRLAPAYKRMEELLKALPEAPTATAPSAVLPTPALPGMPLPGAVATPNS